MVQYIRVTLIKNKNTVRSVIKRKGSVEHLYHFDCLIQKGACIVLDLKIFKKLNYKIVKRIAVISFAILFLALCVFFIVAWANGKFDSLETLQAYIGEFGFWGPLILTLIQAVQVVIPILPGFLGSIVGGLLFGMWPGFWCNYIGISAGSLLAFLIAKKCGKPLVDKMFKGEKYEKVSNWAANSKSYSVSLFLATLLPLFPDDFFCYFSGLTNMSFKKFSLIIILGKPWCLLAYAILVEYGFTEWLFNLLA